MRQWRRAGIGVKALLSSLRALLAHPRNQRSQFPGLTFVVCNVNKDEFVTRLHLRSASAYRGVLQFGGSLLVDKQKRLQSKYLLGSATPASEGYFVFP